LTREARINQMEIEIDDFAVSLLALQQPMARDLRFLTAAIKINSDLERMGDLAVNIVQRALSLMRQPLVKPLIDIPQLARLAESMVHKSLDAFVRRDAELAARSCFPTMRSTICAMPSMRSWSTSWSAIHPPFRARWT